jgi:hypothetical protein
MVTVRVGAVIVTVAEFDAVAELPSVALTDTVNVPAVLYVVLKLEPVPVDGEPPVAVQAKVYGVVPPVADAVHEMAVPVLPELGQVIEAASGSPAIVTVADFVPVFGGEAESVPVTLIV